MTAPGENPAPLNPLELIEAARSKYTLALARARHGPPELALLSLHGSLEDVLRAHALRLRLPAAYGPFSALIEALIEVEQAPLSEAEADALQRMHRLRAHVVHGEHIAVTEATISAYHRLTARLLPRYGIIVAQPETPPASDTTSPTGRGEKAERSLGGGPRRERTVYPDEQPARYAGRPLPSAATRDLPLARELLKGKHRRRSGTGSAFRSQIEAFWARLQRWLLPVVIGLGLLILGLFAANSVRMQMQPVAPTAAVTMPTLAAAPLTPLALPAPTALPSASSGTPTATVAANQLAIGKIANVRAESGALNVRSKPGTDASNPIQMTLSPGTAVEIIDGPVSANGLTWWKVRAAGAEGWCAGQWLDLR